MASIMAAAGARQIAQAAKPPINYSAAFNRAIGSPDPAAARQYERGQASADYRQQWVDTAGARDYFQQNQRAELGNQQSIAGIQAGAQLGAAKASADAQRYGAGQSAISDRFRAQTELAATKVQADAAKFGAEQSARAQLGVARTAAGSQRYTADIGLRSDMAGYASGERVAAGQQAGENFRSSLGVARDLITNQADNFTQQRGQLFGYMGQKAATQYQAPTSTDVRWW